MKDEMATFNVRKSDSHTIYTGNHLVIKLSYLNYYKAYTVTITEDGFWGNI